MAIRTIDDVEVRGSRVLMRVDFNVPMRNGAIADDRRIRAALPSIRSVLERGGRLVLMSHLGRPGGTGFEAPYSLRPVAARLGELLGDLAPDGVGFPSEDCGDDAAARAIETLHPGEVLLLENLRFHPGEKKGDADFAARLASFGDVYCNDAFGTSHRAHASMFAVPMSMKPRPAVAGRLVAAEVRFLRESIESPERPFTAILGGAKVSDKLGAISHLLDRVDHLVIGGAMAYTLLAAHGTEVGDSLLEREMIGQARELIERSHHARADITLPFDHVCGRALAADTPVEVHEGGIPAGWMGLDIGPKSAARFGEIARASRTVVWNGPMGVFEVKPFDAGTHQVGLAVAQATRDHGAVTIAGGGDTAAAVERFGLADALTHVSTGGGASLEMLEGGELVGLEPLDEA